MKTLPVPSPQVPDSTKNDVSGGEAEGLDRYISWPIYLTDTDSNISVSENWTSVSVILVSANFDIGYIGIS